MARTMKFLIVEHFPLPILYLYIKLIYETYSIFFYKIAVSLHECVVRRIKKHVF